MLRVPPSLLLLLVGATALTACNLRTTAVPPLETMQEAPALPPIPAPSAAAAEVPAGYRVEVAVKDLIYPTSVEFDDAGAMYIAEGGFAYGDPAAPARILRVSRADEITVAADGLNGPVTDLLWHDGRLYISHRGKISTWQNGQVRDL